jgi:hypothetical protein
MLSFDEAKHEYKWQGSVVPHVTGILAPLISYSMVPRDTLELARQKGQHVHKMVELDALGKLDLDALPAWMRPIHTQWRKFVEDTGFIVLATERKVFHPAYNYAGMLDLRGIMHNHQKYCGHGILDIKRSFMAGGVTGLQTAAYAEADDAGKEWDQTVSWRGALKLNENGPYRFEAFDKKSDFSEFLVCLTYARIKEKYLEH